MEGWIKLHRQILEWEWADDAAVFSTWVHCILLANHTDGKWHGKTIPRGSFITSMSELSRKVGISVSQLRTVLRKLKLTNELTIETTNKFSIITICKYDSYQIDEQESDKQVDTQVDKQMTNNSQTDDNQLATNKNEKNERMEEELYSQTPREDVARIDYAPYFSTWNSVVASCPKVLQQTDKRKKALKKRIEEMRKVGDPLEVFKTCCEKIQASDFLSGRSGKWKNGANFDWLATAQGNWVKVYEGNYDEKKNTTTNAKSNFESIWGR